MPERRFNLADLFEVVVDTVPGRLALVAGPRRLTYRELDQRSNRFGHYLEERGVRTGAHVGILAYNRAEWAETMIGCFKARTVPVNLNYRYTANELRYVIDNADLEVLVFEKALTPLVAEALVDNGAGGSPLLVVIDDGSDVEVDVDVDALPAVSYESALGAVSPDRGFGPRSPDDIYVLYTGGTTGMPKGVLWRQEDIFFAAMGGGGWGTAPITDAEELAGRLNPDDATRVVMLVVAPLMHGNAQWVMWNALMMGGTAVLFTGHRYDPDVLWRLIGDEGVVSVGLVGDAMARPLVDALVDAPPGTYETSTLLVVGSGGAMLSKTVKDELVAHLPGIIVLDNFGSSESGAQGAVQAGASGPRFAMNEDTSVLDDDLSPLTPGDGRIGRLARRGRIPIGYYKDPAKTEATFPVDRHGVRWSIPGDQASIDPDGSITVHGRGSASINSGGEKIFPEEVEAAIKSHPGVYDAIVVGIPDERFGQRVAVAVRPRDASAPPSLEELQAHCRVLIAGYKIPRQLLVVEAIPLTASGKPDTRTAASLF
jgi:acyl-CoA synthetase (AMP-forming)/AMP-acid ligase II